jgi:hypothetical protein
MDHFREMRNHQFKMAAADKYLPSKSNSLANIPQNHIQDKHLWCTSSHINASPTPETLRMERMGYPHLHINQAEIETAGTKVLIAATPTSRERFPCKLAPETSQSGCTSTNLGAQQHVNPRFLNLQAPVLLHVLDAQKFTRGRQQTTLSFKTGGSNGFSGGLVSGWSSNIRSNKW